MGNGHGKLQDEQESLSVHQSAHISHEESAALQACFLKRFHCHQISEEAFIHYYHEVYGDSLRNPLVTHLLRRIEDQKAGIISCEEFVKAFGMIRNGSLEQRMDWLFSLYADNENPEMADKLEILELVRTVYRVKCTTPDGEHDKPELSYSAEERMRRAFFTERTLEHERLINKTRFRAAWANNPDIWKTTVETITSLLQELFNGMKKEHVPLPQQQSAKGSKATTPTTPTTPTQG